MTDKTYRSVLSGRLDNLPTLNSRLVRIFISSTFTDTKEERNLLLEDVYPKLKSHCKETYGMDFQLVDMRWGVPVDAADDHMASKICMEEIENCQKLSTGPNFVTFLNQKHGYRPLQLTIQEQEFSKLVSCLNDHKKDTALIEKWYQKDENQIPAVYVLQPISSLIPGYKDKQNSDAKAEWDNVFNQLRKDFKFASRKLHEEEKLSEQEKHKYFMSVTEEEISCGILQLQKNPTDHCLCFVRIIEDLTSHLDHSKAWRFIDIIKEDQNKIDEEAQGFLSELRDEKIVKKLQNFNITKNVVKWSEQDGINGPLGLFNPFPHNKILDWSELKESADNNFKNVVKWSEQDGINRLDHQDYLSQFKETFYNGVIALIEKAVKDEASLIQDELYIEVLQHLVMASERCATFQGREEILQQIKYYLTGSETSPLVLYGQSGCGKTSIMAQTAKMVPSVKDTSAVILRFLGTSPDSSNLWRLLHSLCVQILTCYQKDNSQVPEDLSELKQFFLESLKLATADKPLVVLLDSLDQLSREQKSYKLNWLPRKLPPHVKFIVSSYTEAKDLIGTLRLLYLSDCFILVPIFSQELSSQVLTSWLKKENRCLSEDQFSIVEKVFEQCSLPLYVKLTYDRVVQWHSYTPLSECALNHTVQSSIEYLFQQLEKKHGQVLVSRAMAYLSASRVGLSETELEDLLSLDDIVLSNVFQIHIPPVRRIPPLLLVRIRYDISQYLVDKEIDDVRSFFWYHRQFYEVCNKKYLSDKNLQLQIHSDMADYYIGKWYGKMKPFKYTTEQMKKFGETSPDGEADRKIAPQPLIFNADKIKKSTRFNKRKLSRLPYHLYSANRREELRNLCLFNYEWLRVKLRATSIQGVLLDFALFGEKESVLVKVLKACQSTLKLFPETLSLEISGRLLALLQTKAANHEQNLLDQTLKASGKECRIVPYQPCYTIPSEAQMYQIEHQHIQRNTTMFDMSDDGCHLAILSGENEVLLYDVKTGELDITVPLPFDDEINVNVMVKPYAKDVIVAACTNQMKANIVVLMDVNTGIIEGKLNLDKLYPKIGFTDEFTFEVTDDYLISHVLRQAADVFDRHTGKLVHEFEGQPDQMSLFAEDKYILLHPKQTNVYMIYKMAGFQLTQQITCDGTPEHLFMGSQSYVACIVMKGVPRIQMVNMVDNANIGTNMGDINLASHTNAVIKSAWFYSNVCLIATIEKLFLWDLKTRKLKHSLEIPEELVPSYRVTDITAYMTTDLSTVIAAYTVHYILWDAVTGAFIHSIEASRGLFSKAVLSSSSDVIINTTRRSNTVSAWNVNTMKIKTQQFEPLSMSDAARYLAVNRKGTVAVVRSSSSTEFAVIDVQFGTKRLTISEEYEAMNPYVTEDGKYAVLREYHSNNCLKTWDLTTGQLVSSLPVSSLSLKGYVLGTRPDNMAILIEDETSGEQSLHFCHVPSSKMNIKIQLPKYNIMQIVFVQNDEYCLMGIEEQLHPGVKIYAKAFNVMTGELVQHYDEIHPKNIQSITPEHPCLLGHRKCKGQSGNEYWELAVVNIRTGETVAVSQDVPISNLCFGSIGRHGISKRRIVYDIKKGIKCVQFDKDGDNMDSLPSARTAPKMTSDEKYALWLSLSKNLLMVGNVETGSLVSVCPIHSIPMNIQVTPDRIILIGCEDGRIMMLQMLVNENEDAVSMFKNIFNRSKRRTIQQKRSLMKPMNISQRSQKKTDEVKTLGQDDKTGSSKACHIL